MENFTADNFWTVCLAIWKMGPWLAPMIAMLFGFMVWEKKTIQAQG